MSKIFISYRRDDSAGHTGHLYSALCQHFGDTNVFRDLDNIPAGSDFAKHIETSISGCSAVIVVIGKDWLAADAEGKRRIDNARDFVRLEIRAALARGICIVPALVEGATMPAASKLPPTLSKLARFQAQELSDVHWEHDVQRLVQTLSTVVTPSARVEEKTATPGGSRVFVAAPAPDAPVAVAPAGGGSSLAGQTVRTFDSAGADLSVLATRLAEWLRNDQFEVQVLDPGDCLTIQARQVQKWRQALGMSSALTIVLRPAGSRLTVEVGGAKWADKVAAGAVGVMLGVGAITPIFGAWVQKKYPEKVFARVESFLGASAAPTVTPISRPLAGAGPRRFCEGCGTLLSPSARFCSGCGFGVATG